MKKYKSQKKKTSLSTFLNILFKLLVAIAVILFIFIAYKKVNFSTAPISFPSKKGNSSVNSQTPSELRWFNDFKGIENVTDKNKKKSSSSNGNTGFKYEGFKK